MFVLLVHQYQDVQVTDVLLLKQMVIVRIARAVIILKEEIHVILAVVCPIVKVALLHQELLIFCVPHVITDFIVVVTKHALQFQA